MGRAISVMCAILPYPVKFYPSFSGVESTDIGRPFVSIATISKVPCMAFRRAPVARVSAVASMSTVMDERPTRTTRARKSSNSPTWIGQ